MKKKNFDEVYKTFEINNCKLLEKEYINNRTPMRYICECGIESIIRFSEFTRGQRCKKCSYRKKAEKTKLDYFFVKNEFEKRNCVLLEREYKNARTKMKYICSCGNTSLITYTNFKAGNRCSECKRKKLISLNTKHTTESIKTMLKEYDIEIIGQYKGYHSNLEYLCNKCGHKGIKSLNTIVNSKYPCRNCFIKSVSGKNSIHWKEELTNEDRYKSRSTPEDQFWKNEVKKRDNYTCQCCYEQGGKLHSHHIFNYADHIDSRYLLENGITLCEDCHIQYHRIYGKRNNNRKQLEEYLELNRKSPIDLGLNR